MKYVFLEDNAASPSSAADCRLEVKLRRLLGIGDPRAATGHCHSCFQGGLGRHVTWRGRGDLLVNHPAVPLHTLWFLVLLLQASLEVL